MLPITEYGEASRGVKNQSLRDRVDVSIETARAIEYNQNAGDSFELHDNAGQREEIQTRLQGDEPWRKSYTPGYENT